MISIELDSQEWTKGYQDGAAGIPAAANRNLSYYSGWIEGDADRQGCTRVRPN